MLHRLNCFILDVHGGIYCGDIKTFKHIPLCISSRFLTYEFFGLEGSGPSSGISASTSKWSNLLINYIYFCHNDQGRYIGLLISMNPLTLSHSFLSSSLYELVCSLTYFFLVLILLCMI